MLKKNIVILTITVFLIFQVNKAETASCGTCNQLDIGRVSLTFDDGYKNLYEKVFPILSLKKIPATAFIITSRIGDGDHINWNQVWELYWDYGWEIGNHTKSHLDLTKLIDDAQIRTEILDAQTAFIAHGILDVVAFAPPFGAFDSRTTAAVKNLGLTSQRQAWPEDKNDPFNYPDNCTFNPLAINVMQVKNNTDITVIRSRIRQAADDKKWLVLAMHGVVTGTPANNDEITTTKLGEIADYINSQAIEAVTISRGAGRVLYYQNKP